MRTKQNVFEEVINNIVYDLAFHLSRKGRQMRCDTKLVALIEVVMAAIFFKVKKPRRVTYLVKILKWMLSFGMECENQAPELNDYRSRLYWRVVFADRSCNVCSPEGF